MHFSCTPRKDEKIIRHENSGSSVSLSWGQLDMREKGAFFLGVEGEDGKSHSASQARFLKGHGKVGRPDGLFSFPVGVMAAGKM